MKKNIKRGKETFEFFGEHKCIICKETKETYDVIGLIICEDCVKNRITRLSPRTGDIRWRRKNE